nr:hypothetical protein CFP56_02669 [Quercus suber]
MCWRWGGERLYGEGGKSSLPLSIERERWRQELLDSGCCHARVKYEWSHSEFAAFRVMGPAPAVGWLRSQMAVNERLGINSSPTRIKSKTVRHTPEEWNNQEFGFELGKCNRAPTNSAGTTKRTTPTSLVPGTARLTGPERLTHQTPPRSTLAPPLSQLTASTHSPLRRPSSPLAARPS